MLLNDCGGAPDWRRTSPVPPPLRRRAGADRRGWSIVRGAPPQSSLGLDDVLALVVAHELGHLPPHVRTRHRAMRATSISRPAA
jgi:hypothetical protein